jgi:hypothetical protein
MDVNCLFTELNNIKKWGVKNAVYEFCSVSYLRQDL